MSAGNFNRAGEERKKATHLYLFFMAAAAAAATTVETCKVSYMNDLGLDKRFVAKIFKKNITFRLEIRYGHSNLTWG